MSDTSQKIILHNDWHCSDPFGVNEHHDWNGGEVHIETQFFANAIQCWATCQPGGEPTLGAAALAFNTTPDVIAHAVIAHGWMFTRRYDDQSLAEQIIEHQPE
ncbi:MAG: hypothetical protein P1U84_12080 [Parvibaculaceae bacterium]|nr:hypothetical protein [Parvibaculaceae bacterium]